MTGGSAGSGGYNFQAYVIAFVSAHVLVGRRLAWLHHQLGKPDVPVAVSAETGGPGDDVQIDLDFFKFEAQAKKGLRVGARLDETIDRFGRALQANSSSRGVIVVDQTSHSAVKDQLRNDLQRLRDGRDDELKDVTIRVLGRLAALNVSNPKEVASRISVVVLDLEESGGAHRELAQVLLRDRLENPSQEGAAWNALVSDGHQLIQRRGKRDREAIERFIGGKATGTGRIFDVDNMMRVYEYSANLWQSTVEKDLAEITEHIKAAWEKRSSDQSYMKILRRAGAPKAS